MTALELDDIIGFTRLHCTGLVAHKGWVLDQDEILSAMDLLDIQFPVTIRFMSSKYGLGGTHRGSGNKNIHRITLAQNKDIDYSNFYLWHELVHAAQSEMWVRDVPHLDRKISEWYTEYKRGDGEWGRRYSGNKYEFQANVIAAWNEETMLLAQA